MTDPCAECEAAEDGECEGCVFGGEDAEEGTEDV